MNDVSNLPRVELNAGDHRLSVHVARQADDRALGLMHRQALGEDEGLLFIDDRPRPQSFWMKDTPLALSIAFLDDDGTILQLDELQPHSLQGCSCKQPVRHVLEVNQGWFARRGIGPGTRLAGPPFLA